MTWMSPAYPVGAFSYSSGIEWAVEAGDIGSARDAARLARDHDPAGQRVLRCGAVRPCPSRRHGRRRQGARGGRRTRRRARRLQGALPRDDRPGPGVPRHHPRGLADAGSRSPRSGMGRPPRLPRHRRRGLRRPRHRALLPRSMRSCTASCRTSSRPACGSFRSARPTGSACSPRSNRRSRRRRSVHAAIALDEIGTATPRADIASMRHETQYTRLFRSCAPLSCSADRMLCDRNRAPIVAV